jgi:hypothetical protein
LCEIDTKEAAEAPTPVRTGEGSRGFPPGLPK